MTQRYIDFVPAKKRATAAPSQAVPVRQVKPAAKPVAKPVQPVAKPAQPVVKAAPKKASSSFFFRRTVVKTTALPAEPVAKPAAKPVAKPVQPVAKPAPKPETFEPSAKTFATTRELSYGVIEDYEPFFTGAKVEKRPLSAPRIAATPDKTAKKESLNPAVNAENDALAAAKAKKIRSPLFGKGKKEAEKAPEAPAKAEAKKEEPIETLKTPDTPFIKSAKVEKRPLSKNVYQKPAATPAVAENGPVTIIDKPEKDSHIGPVIAIILTIILGAAVGTCAFLLLPKK